MLYLSWPGAMFTSLLILPWLRAILLYLSLTASLQGACMLPLCSGATSLFVFDDGNISFVFFHGLCSFWSRKSTSSSSSRARRTTRRMSSSSYAFWTVELFIRVFEIHGDTVVAYDMKIRVTRSYPTDVPFAAFKVR